MASATRDIRTQSLTLDETDIPLGGDGISARLAYGPAGEITRGVSTSIKTRPNQREGVLSISVYPEDEAEPILRGLYNERRLPDQANLFPGSAKVVLARDGGSVTQIAKWADAHFVAVADMTLGQTSEVATYELALVDLEIESLAS